MSERAIDSRRENAMSVTERKRATTEEECLLAGPRRQRARIVVLLLR